MTALTKAEKDLGPCLSCGNKHLGKWQLVYSGKRFETEVVGAMCFDCVGIFYAEDEHILSVLKFRLDHPTWEID